MVEVKVPSPSFNLISVCVVLKVIGNIHIDLSTYKLQRKTAIAVADIDLRMGIGRRWDLAWYCSKLVYSSNPKNSFGLE